MENLTGSNHPEHLPSLAHGWKLFGVCSVEGAALYLGSESQVLELVQMKTWGQPLVL